MNPMLLMGALAAAGAAFLIVQGVVGMTRRKSILETNAALIAKQKAKVDEKSLAQRIALTLNRYGYEGTVPAASFVGAIAAVISLGLLRTFGLGLVTSALFAGPVTVGAAFLMLARLAASREAKFNRQLLQMLRLVAGELEAGATPQRALEHVAGSVEDPLRRELTTTLDAAKVSGDLVGEFTRLADRFPSRAITLLVTALEIDRDLGAPIQQPLSQAAEALEKDFELEETAKAEAAQVKAEFYAVFVGVGAIAGVVFMQQSPESRAAVLSNIVAITLLGVGIANYVFGFFRVNRMLKKAGQSE